MAIGAVQSWIDHYRSAILQLHSIGVFHSCRGLADVSTELVTKCDRDMAACQDVRVAIRGDSERPQGVLMLLQVNKEPRIGCSLANESLRRVFIRCLKIC